MPVFYLDTSAIVKSYHSERGSQVIDDLLENSGPQVQFHTSSLTLLEGISAIERLADLGQLDKGLARSALARFRRDLRDRFHVWPISNEVITEAASVVGQYRLRSADAIHLATALSIPLLVLASETVMVSSDHRLIRSAQAVGLRVLDPADSGALAQLRQLRTQV